MTTANVIPFPNSHGKVTTPEDVNEQIELVHLYHINESIEAIAPMLFGNLDLAGFDLWGIDEDDEDAFKDRVFILEALKSVLCKKYDIYHPFQQVKENIFTSGDEEGFSIVNDLNLSNLVKTEEETAVSEIL